MAKIFAGFVMDIFKKRLPMLNIGTILTVISKFFLACAPSVFFVFISKAIDRFAKGLRHAPSDTILAEIATKKGYAYSMRYMVNLLGFLVGSITTSIIITTIGKNFRLIFTLAIIPTLFAWHILKSKVNYQDKDADSKIGHQKWKVSDVKLLPKSYWRFLLIVLFLMFNRFSEGFISLRAKEILPASTGNFPLFMALYELFAVCTALIVGSFSDKCDKRKILIVGISLLVIADIVGVLANNRLTVIILHILAGMHMGATQGILSSIVAEIAPKQLYGAAFAVCYFAEGLTLFLANNIAGSAADLLNFLNISDSAGPFILGMFPSFAAIILLIKWCRQNFQSHNV
jgi:MFS family permease